MGDNIHVNTPIEAPIPPKSLMGDLVSANGVPKDAEGRVYHLNAKRGEIANRIISVGDPARALLLSSFLDNGKPMFSLTSNRGFVIHTGRFNNVPISIIATGMGVAMMDFLVRESRAIVDGPLVIIRLGTCGTPVADIPVGSLVVAKSSVLVRRNPDGFGSVPRGDPYSFSLPVPATEDLCHQIFEELKSKETEDHPIFCGRNATADTFYSSQGRVDPTFDDRNENLIDSLVREIPDLISIEMETFHLLDLARCSKIPISAGAAAIVLAQRRSNKFLSNDEKHFLEKKAGLGILEVLSRRELDESLINSGSHCVWNLN